MNGLKKLFLTVSGWILILSLAFEPFNSYADLFGTAGLGLVFGSNFRA